MFGNPILAMGDVTKHFSRWEFACKDGCGFDAVDRELTDNLEELAADFLKENTRAKRVIIHINSGNRCRDYDHRLKIKLAIEKGLTYVKRDSRSQHINGIAADFWMEFTYEEGVRSRISDDRIAEILEMRYPGKHGIGRYDNRTHYDVRKNPARWDNRTGK